VQAASSIRVMVVEDFRFFREFVCSELRLVCEVSDGLEAVQKAEELRSDLILLDIGPRTLNGMEAARWIRKVVPESRIIFATQESSPEIVQEAMRLGACACVFKSHAADDLLSAIIAVLSGKQFVSSASSLQFGHLRHKRGTTASRRLEFSEIQLLGV
jgi:DNA-binding NarL/FixJ family response regulator